jgi:6-pyruvoyltetrahydropterin/6-carboxytetrahydropterin synthase
MGVRSEERVSFMYKVAVKRDFIAQHFLIGGDWGPENEKHSHHYQVEVQLEGRSLDQHGYLVDIVDIENFLESIVERFRDKTLNDLSEFEGLNPSIEHFSRILCQLVDSHVQAENIQVITIKLWENDIAWSSYQVNR